MLIFQNIDGVRSNICPICQQTSECLVQRTTLTPRLNFRQKAQRRK